MYLTKDYVKKIEHLRNMEFSVREISDELNIKYSTLYKFMIRNFIDTTPICKGRLTVKKVKPLLKRGKCVNYIARECRVSYTTALKFINENKEKLSCDPILE